MSNKNSTILVLNGKHYDALTGAVVTPGPGAKAARLIDDFGGAKPAPRQPKPESRPVTNDVPVAKSVVKSSAKSMDVKPMPKHVTHHQQQRSNTLIRTSVSKPAPGLRLTSTHAKLPANIPSATVAQKWPVAQIDPKRLRRAEHVDKSQQIYKFAPGETILSPIEASAVRIDSVADTTPVVPSQHKSQELFEHAIAAANSHEQPAVDPKKLVRTARKQAKHAAKATKRRPAHHHLASVVAASFAVLAIGGFVALQNKAAITLRFADAKAGFHANVPGYQPDGYGMSNFSYSAGNIAIAYHDSDASRSYTIRQQTTKWSSEQLLDNFITMNYQSYQILQSGNQIIYLYGHGNASWVKDGIWYQLTSGGNLSNSQVLSIATSV